MAMVVPNVSYNETTLTPTSTNERVTMPLFIGYQLTSLAATSAVKIGQLVSVCSIAQVKSNFGEHGTLVTALYHFFDNGGIQCYVLPIENRPNNPIDYLQTLITTLQDPQLIEVIVTDDTTGMILVPELSELNDQPATTWQDQDIDPVALWYQGWQAILALCCQSIRRFALLELPESTE